LKKKSSNVKVLNQDAVVFCFRNGYKIYPVIDKGVYNVMVEYGSKRKKYHINYSQSSIHDGIIDMYDLIYEKQKHK
jgi:hypothetical protein